MNVCLGLLRSHVRSGDDVEVARRGDEQIGGRHEVFESLDFVTFHRRLQRADRVDLRNNDACALALESLSAALADFAITADHGDFAGQHDVGRAIQTVDDGVAAAVDVVELVLGGGIIDVDRRAITQKSLIRSRRSRSELGAARLAPAAARSRPEAGRRAGDRNQRIQGGVYRLIRREEL